MSGIEELLAQCLKEIEEGSSVEECLARHPERREELEPLLHTAQRMRGAPRVEPSPTFRQHARTRLMNVIEPRTSAAGSRQSSSPRQRGVFQRLGLATPTMVIVMVIVLLATTGLGVVHASSRSLPGDPLYEVKLATERIRLTLSPTQAGVARAHLAAAERRLEEANRLAEANGEKYMETLMHQYVEQVQAANEALQNRRLRDDQVAPLAEHFGTRLTHHQEILTQVREHTPEEAYLGIDQAIKASQKAREQAAGSTDKPERPRPQGPPSHAPAGPKGDPPDTEGSSRPRPMVSPSPRAEESDGGTPSGHTQTPRQPEQTMTPQGSGQTMTPQGSGQTVTPPAPDASENGAPREEAKPTEHSGSPKDSAPAGPEPTEQPTFTKAPVPTEESKLRGPSEPTESAGLSEEALPTNTVPPTEKPQSSQDPGSPEPPSGPGGL
ncbi:MAG: DUF5667 domain-containing protein [Chloroflexota bacterium]